MGRCRAHACAALLAVALLLALLPVGPAQAALVGSISGVVTAAGRPLAYAWVSIIPVTPEGLWAGRGVVTSTDARGRYQVDDVYTDFVKVEVRGPSGLAITYWPDAYTFGDATPVRVTSAGARADVDLPRGGSVSGQVVDARTREPVAGARVTAYAVSGTMWEQVGAAALGAGTQPGSFAITDLPPVPVALWVMAPFGSRQLSSWYDDAALIGEARWIDGAATTSGLEVGLRKGAELTGTVRDDVGTPVPGATVTVLGCSTLCPAVARTDEEGRFRFAALDPGRGVRVRAEAESAGYVDQWYMQRDGAGEVPIDLAAGQQVTGVDLVLTRGAFVSLRVVDDRTGAVVPEVSADLRTVGEPMLTFPSHVRQADPAAVGAAPDPAQPSPAGLLGALPTVAPDPVGDVAPATGGGDGSEDADALEIGPVPPGEYQLVLYPGPRNASYLPVVWGSVTAVGPDGRIRLAAGQRVAATVGLVSSADPSGPSGAPRPPSSGDWPGLWAGFLDPPAPWAG